jgi:hypothetical protein
MPVFLKIFAIFCIFLIPVLTLWISPGLLVHVNPALFLVYPAKECHPWTLSPFLICHPSFFIVTPAKAGVYPLALEAAIILILTHGIHH